MHKAKTFSSTSGFAAGVEGEGGGLGKSREETTTTTEGRKGKKKRGNRKRNKRTNPSNEEPNSDLSRKIKCIERKREQAKWEKRGRNVKNTDL